MLRRVARPGAQVMDCTVVGDHPSLPDYAGPCVHNIVPALIGRRGTAELPSWMPAEVRPARQIVLLLLDGLGWEQLQACAHRAPTLCSLKGRPIHTVVPSTTATALTSISTGLTPGEHGVVGYRIDVHGEILNVLRWSTPAGDARKRIPPTQFQPIPPFLGANVPVVTKAEFTGSGFSMAHLSGARQIGFRMPSSLVVEVRRLLGAGEPFVYAYYEGIDKVAHEYGLDEHFEAELAAADRLVADLLAVLPPDAALLVTADHGQVDCGDRVRRGSLPVAARPSRRRERFARRGHGRLRGAGLGGPVRPGARRRVVRATPQPRRRRTARLGGAGGARTPGLRRPRRQRALPPGEPARLAHLGGDDRAAARRPERLTLPVSRSSEVV